MEKPKHVLIPARGELSGGPMESTDEPHRVEAGDIASPARKTYAAVINHNLHQRILIFEFKISAPLKV